MSVNTVRAQLIGRLGCVGLGWPVRWENVAFEIPVDGRWVAVGFWPDEPETVTLGRDGAEQLTGWLQVDLNVPVNTGESALLDAFAKFRACFPPGYGIASGGVETTVLSCGRSPARRVDQNFRISVTVRFRARYNKNT